MTCILSQTSKKTIAHFHFLLFWFRDVILSRFRHPYFQGVRQFPHHQIYVKRGENGGFVSPPLRTLRKPLRPLRFNRKGRKESAKGAEKKENVPFLAV